MKTGNGLRPGLVRTICAVSIVLAAPWSADKGTARAAVEETTQQLLPVPAGTPIYEFRAPPVGQGTVAGPGATKVVAHFVTGSGTFNFFAPGASPRWAGDVIQLETTHGCVPDSLTFYLNNNAVGPVNATFELYDGNPCTTGTLIPGAQWTFNALPGLSVSVLTVDLSGVAWLPPVVHTKLAVSNTSAGPIIAIEQRVGASTNTFCRNTTSCSCAASFGGVPPGNFMIQVNCKAGPSCDDGNPDNGVEYLSEPDGVCNRNAADCGDGTLRTCCVSDTSLPNNVAGCDDAACCADVCTSDPFCCQVNWDASCAAAAATSCAVCQGYSCGSAIPGDCCTDPILVTGSEVVSLDNTAYTDDGAPDVSIACGNSSETGFNNDAWYRYDAQASGILIISTCGYANFDTRIAAYRMPGGQVNCAELSKLLIECNEDCNGDPDSGSQLFLSVIAGESYLIRVGGYATESGQADVNFYLLPDSMASTHLCPGVGSQPPVPSDRPNQHRTSHALLNIQAYDNFNAGGTYGEVIWNGVFIADNGLDRIPCDNGPTQFRISFFENIGGTIGPVFCAYDVTPTRVSSGGRSPLDPNWLKPLFNFRATLDPPCTLNGPLWISIQATDGKPSCWFDWWQGTGGDGSSLQDFMGDLQKVNNDRSFCLGGLNDEGACCQADNTCTPTTPAGCTTETFHPDTFCSDGLCGSCCFEGVERGCNNYSCKNDVCNANSTCCTDRWHEDCARLAKQICPTCGARPPNDTCLDALEPDEFSRILTVLANYYDSPEQLFNSCSPDIQNDVWWTYESPCTGSMEVKIQGADSQQEGSAIIAVYNSTPTPCDFENGPGVCGSTNFDFPVDQGAKYILQIINAVLPDSGPYHVEINCKCQGDCCNDGNDCTDDANVNGTCVITPKPNGTACQFLGGVRCFGGDCGGPGPGQLPCNTDADCCDADQRCVAGACRKPCTKDADCPPDSDNGISICDSIFSSIVCVRRPQPSGSTVDCCRTNGTCAENVPPEDCDIAANEWPLDSGSCADDPEACGRGACCFELTGACREIPKKACAPPYATSHTFRGVGTSCVTEVCPACSGAPIPCHTNSVDTFACCLPTPPHCEELTIQQCEVQGGTIVRTTLPSRPPYRKCPTYEDPADGDSVVEVCEIGACCNELTGSCAENVTDTDCPFTDYGDYATGLRFGGHGSTCATLDPPCGAPATPQEAANLTTQDGTDCNRNGIGDCLDIFLGFSPDANLDGIPDECQPCAQDSDCSDGNPCNGVERCNGYVCEDGQSPCDGAAWCNPSTGECTLDPAGSPCTNDNQCDDGKYCNGPETCDTPSGQCLPSVPPCDEPNGCDEFNNTCGPCTTSVQCAPGRICGPTGQCEPCVTPSDCDLLCSDPCSVSQWQCVEGTCVPDEPACPSGSTCFSVDSTCGPCGSDSDCDDGNSCTEDSCDAEGTCVYTPFECPAPGPGEVILCQPDAPGGEGGGGGGPGCPSGPGGPGSPGGPPACPPTNVEDVACKAYVLVGDLRVDGPPDRPVDAYAAQLARRAAEEAQDDYETAGYDVLLLGSARISDFLVALKDPNTRALWYIGHGTSDKAELHFHDGSIGTDDLPSRTGQNTYPQIRQVTLHAPGQRRNEWRAAFVTAVTSGGEFDAWLRPMTIQDTLAWQIIRDYDACNPNAAAGQTASAADPIWDVYPRLQPEHEVVVYPSLVRDIAPVANRSAAFVLAEPLLTAMNGQAFNFRLEHESQTSLLFSVEVSGGTIDPETQSNSPRGDAFFDITVAGSIFGDLVENPDQWSALAVPPAVVVNNTSGGALTDAEIVSIVGTVIWGIPSVTTPPPPDIVWDSNAQQTRSLTFTAEPPAAATGGAGTSAIKVTLVDLENPTPPNNNPAGPCCPPGNFVGFDTAVNAVCAGGNDQGYRCPPSACPGSTCSAAVGCSEAAGPNSQGICARWVGPPLGYLESNDNPGLGNYRAARLQCTPYYHDWAAEAGGGLVNVLGSEIVPSSSYQLQVYGSSCKGAENGCTNVSTAVVMSTRRAGDIATPFQGAPPLTQPNAIDVTNAVNKFRNLAGSPPKVVSQVQPNFPDPNADINAIDIVTVVDNQRGFGYTYSGPCVCPSSVPCNTTACAGASACTGLYGAGATCIKTCSSGPRTGQPCNNNLNCGACIGGPATGNGAAGIPCDANADCASGNCGLGVCPTGATPGFCRDRCGRCN